MSDPNNALKSLWSLAKCDPAALGRIRITGSDPVLPSSFRVGTAAAASIGAAALMAAELWRMRTGQTQTVAIVCPPCLPAAIPQRGSLALDGSGFDRVALPLPILKST